MVRLSCPMELGLSNPVGSEFGVARFIPQLGVLIPHCETLR